MEKAKKELSDETGIIFTFGINAENQDDPRVKEMMDKTLDDFKKSNIGKVLGLFDREDISDDLLNNEI